MQVSTYYPGPLVQSLSSRHAAQMHAAEKSKEKANVDIRMCKDCKHTLFSKSDFAHELSRATPDQRSFHNLKQFERGIRVMLPRFQKLLNALQYIFSLHPSA